MFLRLTVLLALESIAGYALPPLGGHVTDPSGKLSTDQKKQVEAIYNALQSETKIDVTALIAPISEAQLEPVGRAALARWKIGRDWQTGMMLVLSEQGSAARLVQAEDDPRLTPDQARAVEAAALKEASAGHWLAALQVGADRLGAILKPAARGLIVPRAGVPDVGMARRYGFGAICVLLWALIASTRRWIRQ